MGPLQGKTVQEIYGLFADPASAQGSGLPHWPMETEQKRFTGASGLPLLSRAKNFVDMIEADGAFVAGWKALDYGCGWGRIASYMLTRGTPDQLDMCDAWDRSLELARNGGFKNRMFKVSDLIQDGEIPQGHYDFCYALSVFTHISRPLFENNLRRLTDCLKPGGRFYFTVRSEEFFDILRSAGKAENDAALGDDGFWHATYAGRTNYGETIVSRSYLDRLSEPCGALDYVGKPEYEQHLYRITRAA